MDKTKFTINPQLDSEGFVRSNVDIDNAIEYALRLNVRIRATLDAINPRGWNEPGMQPITWADENPDTTTVDIKRLCAEVLLRGHA